ncbi:MAG: hypothetical protein LBF89_01170 [Bacteroidales bacterium]|nr:hypothetical protein [Bacteroidales bacterium]
MKKILFLVLFSMLAAGRAVPTAESEALKSGVRCTAAFADSGVRVSVGSAPVFNGLQAAAEQRLCPLSRFGSIRPDGRTKAELGNIIYIIIILLALFGGIFEKLLKAKKSEEIRRQQTASPSAELPETEEVVGNAEEIISGWLETRIPDEAETEETTAPFYETLETIPDEPEHMIKEKRYGYQPISAVATVVESPEEEKYVFDVREAIIANEILNRKY